MKKPEPRQIFAMACAVLFAIWLFWPSAHKAKPAPSGPPEPGRTGSTVSVSQPSVCAPSADALSRIIEAGVTDKEEFLRTAGREARRAGWEGPVFVSPPDRVKVVETSFTKARVRLLDEKYQGAIPRDADDECWVTIEAVRQ
jgi:hypothetical protein